MSTSPWNVFDHPYPIKRRTVTRASVNQTTGVITPESSTETTITGDFQPNMAQEDIRASDAILSPGDAVLFTDTILAIEDRIQVYLDTAGTQKLDFRVKALFRTHSLMGTKFGAPDRRSYVLAKETKKA